MLKKRLKDCIQAILVLMICEFLESKPVLCYEYNKLVLLSATFCSVDIYIDR